MQLSKALAEALLRKRSLCMNGVEERGLGRGGADVLGDRCSLGRSHIVLRGRWGPECFMRPLQSKRRCDSAQVLCFRGYKPPSRALSHSMIGELFFLPLKKYS